MELSFHGVRTDKTYASLAGLDNPADQEDIDAGVSVDNIVEPEEILLDLL